MKLGHVQNLHFIGIGGTGMNGIARIMLALGYDVSGSDARDSATVQALRTAGATVAIGHDESNIGDADVVIRSTAIPDNNPEILAAQQARLPVIHRSEMLSELMRLKQGIAVAGAHGKTTTTSLIAWVAEGANLDPTVVIGGRVKDSNSHGRLGQGDLLIAEADESDGSFLTLRPVLAVINNIDEEHMDYWGDFDALKSGMVAFANSVPFYGSVLMCQDDPRLAALRPRIQRPVRTFAVDSPADIEGQIIDTRPAGCEFDVLIDGERVATCLLPLAGKHNVRNALAAIGVAAELGVDPARAAKLLESFPGIERRFEILHADGPIVVDDYGHHPVEIAATLDAARQRWGKEIWAIFQPHRFSRTSNLWDEFRACLLAPDHLRITEIYSAGEDPMPGIDSASLALAVHESGHPDARFAPFDDLINHLNSSVNTDAVVLFLGAGSISGKAHEYVAQLA